MRGRATLRSPGNARIVFGVLVLLALGAAGASAQSAEVTYVQGGVALEPSGGRRSEALIGDAMNPGDSIITSSDGLAQLQKQNLSELTVSPGTVFTLRQIDRGGKKRDVLQVGLGELAFKFNELGGREPLIATMSATAGIRGTVLKVYAGADGSSLFLVEAGKVTVTGAAGKSVDLTKNEGVEVSPGLPPGKKVTVLRGQVDYRTWNAGRLERIMQDPAAVARSVERQMGLYIAHIDKIWPEYQAAHAALIAQRQKLTEVQKRGGEQARRAYYAKHVYPLELQATALFLNLRYYSLSALSLRRYVLGRMYIRLTSHYIMREGAPTYEAFLAIYRQIVAEFQRSVVPHLVAADI